LISIAMSAPSKTVYSALCGLAVLKSSPGLVPEPTLCLYLVQYP